jgi:hypothetical protein
MASSNPYGKTRKQGDPYAVYKSTNGWTWNILKLNQRPELAAKNHYAIAFCEVSSPHTHGGSDLGDTYLNDIQGLHVSGPDILKECGRDFGASLARGIQFLHDDDDDDDE